jgi:GDP-mannose 6-dehydrogenase
MNIAIFGAGYVGSVSAACLAQQGENVVLVDVDPDKIDMINQGRAPIKEPGLSELITANVENGRLRATQDIAAAIAETELCLICVGTPSGPDGDIDLGYVRQVCGQIGAALAGANRFYSVVVRSTMLPGSMRGTVIPCLEEASGLKAGEGFGVAIYPEFLRESTAIEDFRNPAIILLGTLDGQTRDQLRVMNAPLTATEILTDIQTAEAVKYTNNAWHATKVAFANEIGNLCKSAGIDSHRVMDILCQDRRLNISSAYLRPGFAFGGSCLPKDLRALVALGRRNGVRTPFCEALLEANQLQIDRAHDMIISTGRTKVGLLGLTFKSGTDDLRESPLVALAERLVESGVELKIYDENVKPANGHAVNGHALNGHAVNGHALNGSGANGHALNGNGANGHAANGNGANGHGNGQSNGANGDYAHARLGNLSPCMAESLDDLYAHSEVIVVGNKTPDFIGVADQQVRAGKEVIDLVRINATVTSHAGYQGICW